MRTDPRRRTRAAYTAPPPPQSDRHTEALRLSIDRLKAAIEGLVGERRMLIEDEIRVLEGLAR